MRSPRSRAEEVRHLRSRLRGAGRLPTRCRAPGAISAIVVQNGNAYDEGIANDFWKPFKNIGSTNSKEKRDALRGLSPIRRQWQYTTGAKSPEFVGPGGAAEDQFLLDRTGNDEIQLDLSSQLWQ